MRRYNIVMQTESKIIVDEIIARDLETAIRTMKVKYAIDEIVACIATLLSKAV